MIGCVNGKMGDMQSVPARENEQDGTWAGAVEASESGDDRFLPWNYPSQRREADALAVPVQPVGENGSSARTPADGNTSPGNPIGRTLNEAADHMRLVFSIDGKESPDEAAKATGETPEQEFICSVCLELLWKPVVLECGHVFCFWCGYQCMNAYDASRCPLCKNAFDKFPRVCRPLNVCLLRHFPRTTALRDLDMAEFEANRRRQSPCHLRIADSSSGASTDTVSRCSPHLLQVLREKAPDILDLMLCKHKSTREKSDVQGRDECSGSEPAKTETENESKDESSGFPEECAIMEDVDEGDTNIGPIDMGSVVTGHVRSRGDDPVQPMEPDDEDSPQPEQERPPASSPTARSAETEAEEAAGVHVLETGDSEERASAGDSESEDGDTLGSHPLFSENLLAMEDFVHYGVSCDGCGKLPVVGRRYTCMDCGKNACDFDLCGACHDAGYSKRGRFNQNHSSEHEVLLVEHSASEWWIQSLNRMRKIHPELSVHQILQWILMHYQDIRVADSQQSEEPGMTGGAVVEGTDIATA